MRTKTEKERDQWVKALKEVKENTHPNLNETSNNVSELTNQIDAKLENLSKTIKLAISLETVLASRLELLKTGNNISNGTDSMEESSSSDKKKNRKSIKKSAHIDFQSDSVLYSNAQEFHKTSKQIIHSCETLLKNFIDLKNNMLLYKNLIDTSANFETSKSKEKVEGKGDDHDTEPPFIIYEDDNSDSDVYFDPEEYDSIEEDSSDENVENEKPQIVEVQVVKGLYDVNKIQSTYDDCFAIIPEGWKPRTSLPGEKDLNNKASLWKLLKDSVGKDLSRVTVPIQFSEPTSMLQKLAEDFEYVDLIHKAANEPDSLLRLIHIFGFAASGYASTIGRISKPFNPILGETYEWCNKEKNFRFISEQVSHHPPISACYVDSPAWVLWSHIHVKNKFWGKSIEIIPSGPITLIIHKYGDHFTWSKLTSSINNLFVGQKSVDHFGQLTLTNHTTGEKIIADFKKKGIFGSGSHVKGQVYDANGNVVYKIEGKWSDELHAIPVDDSKEPLLIWKRIVDETVNEKEYNLPLFAKQLNELPPWLEGHLPRTDSRLRPDQKLLEEGKIDQAANEKFRLEEKQRAAKRARDEQSIEYHPRWFKLVDKAWIFKGDYWEYRKANKWPDDLPDIF